MHYDSLFTGVEMRFMSNVFTNPNYVCWRQPVSCAFVLASRMDRQSASHSVSKHCKVVSSPLKWKECHIRLIIIYYLHMLKPLCQPESPWQAPSWVVHKTLISNYCNQCRFEPFLMHKFNGRGRWLIPHNY